MYSRPRAIPIVGAPVLGARAPYRCRRPAPADRRASRWRSRGRPSRSRSTSRYAPSPRPPTAGPPSSTAWPCVRDPSPTSRAWAGRHHARRAAGPARRRGSIAVAECAGIIGEFGHVADTAACQARDVTRSRPSEPAASGGPAQDPRRIGLQLPRGTCAPLSRSPGTLPGARASQLAWQLARVSKAWLMRSGSSGVPLFSTQVRTAVLAAARHAAVMTLAWKSARRPSACSIAS